jgi:hypothetical protein
MCCNGVQFRLHHAVYPGMDTTQAQLVAATKQAGMLLLLKSLL